MYNSADKYINLGTRKSRQYVYLWTFVYFVDLFYDIYHVTDPMNAGGDSCVTLLDSTTIIRIRNNADT